MTVKELIDILSDFDPNLEVGGSGHFGEILEIYSVNKSELRNFVEIHIESPGEEPD